MQLRCGLFGYSVFNYFYKVSNIYDIQICHLQIYIKVG